MIKIKFQGIPLKKQDAEQWIPVQDAMASGDRKHMTLGKSANNLQIGCEYVSRNTQPSSMHLFYAPENGNHQGQKPRKLELIFDQFGFGSVRVVPMEVP